VQLKHDLDLWYSEQKLYETKVMQHYMSDLNETRKVKKRLLNH